MKLKSALFLVLIFIECLFFLHAQKIAADLEIYFTNLDKVSRVFLILDDKKFIVRKPYFRRKNLSRGKHYLKVIASPYAPLEEEIYLETGKNILQIGLGKSNSEVYYVDSSDVPYIPTLKIREDNQASKDEKFKVLSKDKKEKQMVRTGSSLGSSGYVFLPSSYVSQNNLFGYRKFYWKADGDTKSADNFYGVYKVNRKTEVGFAYLRVEKKFWDSSDNEFLFSLKREVKKVAGGLYSVGINISGDRINLDNIWGTDWNGGKAHLDIVLENTFYNDNNTFKVGLANRFYFNDGWLLDLEGKYNLTDDYGQGGLSLGKFIREYLIRLGFYWSDLEEEVSSYQLGIERAF